MSCFLHNSEHKIGLWHLRILTPWRLKWTKCSKLPISLSNNRPLLGKYQLIFFHMLWREIIIHTSQIQDLRRDYRRSQNLSSLLSLHYLDKNRILKVSFCKISHFHNFDYMFLMCFKYQNQIWIHLNSTPPIVFQS